MSKMLDFKLPSWKGTASALLLGSTVLVLPGCLERIITVPTPKFAVENYGFSPKYSVAEAPLRKQEFEQDMNSEIAVLEGNRDQTSMVWDQSIAGGLEIVDRWSGVIDYATDPATAASFAIDPFGGVISALGLFTGLGIRRRGDVDPETHRKEKEDSFNYGQQTAKELLGQAGKESQNA